MDSEVIGITTDQRNYISILRCDIDEGVDNALSILEIEHTQRRFIINKRDKKELESVTSILSILDKTLKVENLSKEDFNHHMEKMLSIKVYR